MEFFHDRTRDLLIYPTHSPLVLSALPDARQHNGYLVVPRSLRNSQVLRYYNYPTPPVITDDNYDWPIEPGRTPLRHQKIYANFAALHRRMFNLGDMGTMKTLSTLWTADWLMLQHPPGTFRALIVAPLSALDRVWSKEIFRNFLGRRSFEILHGSAKKRLAGLNKLVDFYIINFDGVGVGAHTRRRFELDGFSKALAERSDIQLAIVDECRAYSDARTKRNRIARLVFGNKPYLFMLTGTPTPNAPTDAYGQAKLVNNAFGKSFATFQSETMYKVSQFKWVPQRDGYDKARQLLSPSIRFDIRDVWDGPPMAVQQREVELTVDQKKLLADLKRDLQITVKSGKQITAINEAALRTKFLQVSLGAVYDENHKEHIVDSEPRLREAEDVLESTNRKVVIFVGLTSILNMLYRRLSKRWKCVVLNGPVSAKQRAENIREFAENPDIKAVIADPGTTAHAINEFALVADTVLWYAPIDKNELYLQGNKRVNRPGQKYPMTVVQLVATPLEAEIYRRLETNTTLQGALLDLVRKGEL